ncbi:UNVERIFIED_CONTAM: zinc finger protein ZFP69 [Trichonephila clavipes]
MHLLIHTKAKPHVCKICCKTFSQRSYLKEHLRILTKESLMFVKYANVLFLRVLNAEIGYFFALKIP